MLFSYTRSVARFLYFLILCTTFLEAKLPVITSQDVLVKAKEIMKAHASQKELTPLIAERILQNYLEELDPNKMYFIEPDISPWLHPSKALLEKLINDYQTNRFDLFFNIHTALIDAIERRHGMEKKIDLEHLPDDVKADEFKDIDWPKSESDLLNRLTRVKSLQIESASKLNDDLKDKSLQRIAKRQAKFEEDMLTESPEQKERSILSYILKATASALDAHTAYFTPGEAMQFMIGVQQRLFGIGVQLRDDLNGFTIVKIVEGGPAALGKELKAKDRIIAINGEPVVGMDITEVVDLIRGEEKTPVILTIIRSSQEEKENKEEKLDISVNRGEVVLKETRYESSYTPFGNGAIGYLRLYSFYQDRDSSSANDLFQEIEKMKQEHNLLGLVLDLRYNSGGLLSQAVAVTGLFISKGIVVSVKDDSGKIQHLRDLDDNIAWNGPLIVLVNRASASASEIVAQTLQDYGRALIVGDSHTFGKGSFQTFTLNSTDLDLVNPQGEYKVTRGRYYTVSGKTPQLTGVLADITVPGPLSELEIGEKFAKYPLENDQIDPNFEDNLSDIPYLQREKIRRLYKFDLQPKLDTYTPFIATLSKNSKQRILANLNYQNFLNEIKKKDDFDEKKSASFGQNDLQLEEANLIMKDLIFLQD